MREHDGIHITFHFHAPHPYRAGDEEPGFDQYMSDEEAPTPIDGERRRAKGMDDEPTTGERIREYRERIGFSQDDLALHLGVHRVTLNRWEQDKAKPPPYLLQYLQLILPKEDE